ncbi:hypothetical protein MMC07_005851 [Pseudocyphellaria aurata]|nr:hypothetical protein [Pseudocyphellaria aurata]
MVRPKDPPLNDENIIEVPPRITIDPRFEIHDKYEKALLDINSLGRPGEVLVMPDNLADKNIDKSFEKKEIIESSFTMDASQILDKIDGEDGMVDSERVVETLENIRLTWKQDRFKVPTISDFEDLSKILYDGFTKRQLLHYFMLQSSRHLDSHLEFFSACSTDLYKRSHWSPGCTPFPGDAPKRLDDLNAEIEAKKESRKMSNPSVKRRMISTNKHSIVDQILRRRWHLRTQEDLKSPGELDVWLSRDHLKLLLNHRREYLRGLAQQYEAKIDVSRSYAVLRVTADFDTCGEVFKSILYLLENIHMNEITLPLDKFSFGQGAKHEEMPIQSLLDQVAKVTSTALRPLFNVRKVNASDQKLRVYHLGPGDEDLEDVRRVLSQTQRRTTAKSSFAFWTGGEKFQEANPILIETEKSLPLVNRGAQWARWSYGTKRKPNSIEKAEKSKQKDVTKQAKKKTPLKSRHSGSIKVATSSRLQGRILASLNYPAKDTSLRKGSAIRGASGLPAHKLSLEAGCLPNSFWRNFPARKTSAVVGHILYPVRVSNKMKIRRMGPEHDPFLQTFFNSQREMLSSITNPRSYLQDSRLTNIEEDEQLRIMLSPAQTTDLTGTTSAFPELTLHIRIDPDTKEASLADVRLILQERQVDLLLPDETADIRFSAESFLPAGGEVDPEIIKFFEASYLDVTGRQRLRTPKSLRLQIPAQAIRILSAASSSSANAESGQPPGEINMAGVSVEYTFTSLEHWSTISGFDKESGFRMQYSIVEAGETGGRRDELRIMFMKRQPKNSKECGDDIGDDIKMDEEPVMNERRLKQFCNAAISLV